MLNYMSEVQIVKSKIISKCENNFCVEISLLKFVVLGRKKDA